MDKGCWVICTNLDVVLFTCEWVWGGVLGYGVAFDGVVNGVEGAFGFGLNLFGGDDIVELYFDITHL